MPKISGTVPTHRHTTIPTNDGPISPCFDGISKILKCEMPQPSFVETATLSEVVALARATLVEASVLLEASGGLKGPENF